MRSILECLPPKCPRSGGEGAIRCEKEKNG